MKSYGTSAPLSQHVKPLLEDPKAAHELLLALVQNSGTNEVSVKTDHTVFCVTSSAALTPPTEQSRQYSSRAR